MENPKAATRIDAFSTYTSNTVAWLTLAMVAITFIVVILRYAFGIGVVWMQESIVWMHGAVFMLGAAWTFQREEHVRVDIFYRKLGDIGQAWVNIVGVLLFLMPFCLFLIYASYDYVAASWAIREVSRDSGGLPYPFLPLIKSALLLMPVMVALQGLSMLLVAVRRLRTH
jgi:TRAP-type mannitol/chloroaromatic compound transport system permease small subunit